jgi:hypothetical protein
MSLADNRSMTIPITQTLEALERRIAELEADIALLNGIIQHLERVALSPSERS